MAAMAGKAGKGKKGKNKKAGGAEKKTIAEPVIGIDLGTTYSCVAVWDDATGSVKVLPNSQGARTTPSYVAFNAQGRVVGQPAKDQAAMNSDNTLYDVKRIIGRPWDDEVVQKEAKNFPFKLEDGEIGPTMTVSWRNEERHLAPEEVSAMVLTEMKRSAEAALGKTCTKAVITVPAHFNDQQRTATKDAGKIAGLEVLRIINEPTAAALAYGLNDKVGQEDHKKAAAQSWLDGEDFVGQKSCSNVLIFDLGGGTFDVSVLSMAGGVFEVRATGGDTHLGGEDFDKILLDWAMAALQEQHGADVAGTVRKSGRQTRRLRSQCEAAKRLLATATTATIEVESIAEDVDLSIELTRVQFESLMEPLFKRCLDTVVQVCKDAGVELQFISDCVLVGGSTRVLALQDRLRAMFKAAGSPLELCKTINPDEAVAVGAAVQGRILAAGGKGGGADLGHCDDLLLLDVTPLSLGIELEGKQMSTLIKKNTPIPCRKARTYTTVGDYQTEIDVVIYEGERPNVDQNNKLGEFLISGVERAKAGVPQVEVTFALDANGILNVSARDKVTNAYAKAEIKADKGRLTDEQIEAMCLEAERYRAEDEEYGRKVALRNACEEALYKAMSKAEDSSELEDIRDWLDADADEATLDEIMAKAKLLNDNHAAGIAFAADGTVKVNAVEGWSD